MKFSVAVSTDHFALFYFNQNCSPGHPSFSCHVCNVTFFVTIWMMKVQAGGVCFTTSTTNRRFVITYLLHNC